MSKKIFICIVLGVAILLTGSAVQADANKGFYVGFNAGANNGNDADWKSPTSSGETQLDAGYTLSGALGYKFGMPRIEGEISYQNNDYDKFIDGGVSSNASGDISALSFMVNGYLDFANSSDFTPFVMLGIGAASVESDLTANGTRICDDDDVVFAYQVGAGVGFAVSPTVSLDLKYFYFGTDDADLKSATGTNFENEYSNHNVTIGVRISF